jgi:hypothetical protein
MPKILTMGDKKDGWYKWWHKLRLSIICVCLQVKNKLLLNAMKFK